MYNEIEYDLTQLGLPNILFARHKRIPGAHPAPCVELHPFMAPLVIKIARARPKWTLVCDTYTTTPDGTKCAGKYEIYHGNEVLGRVWREYDYGRNCEVFCIDNKRLRAKRQRGSETRTKDLTKAFKLVTNSFGAKTSNELVSEAHKQLAAMGSSTLVSKRYEHISTQNRLHPLAMAFVRDKWEELRKYAQGHDPARLTDLDTFHDKERIHRDSEHMYTALSDGRGYVVVLRGNEYIISSGGNTKICAQSELTPYLRRSIGLLKLAENNSYVEGIGLKGIDRAIFILPEEPSSDVQET